MMRRHHRKNSSGATICEHRHRVARMIFPLLASQRTGFRQDALRHADLAEVVQERR